MIAIDVKEWSNAQADLILFDRRIHDAEDRGPVSLRIVGDDSLARRQIHTRYQRLHPVTNTASRTRAFQHAYSRHRALHDFTQPHVRAGYDHAIDTWQWLLRLDGESDVAPQIAALFHDIQRLREPSAKEPSGEDYQAFKDGEALRAARTMHAALLNSSVSQQTIGEAMQIVEHHEKNTPLGEADAMSFFGVTSWRYLRDNGAEQTRKKALHALSRIKQRGFLDDVRHPPVIAAWLRQEPG